MSRKYCSIKPDVLISAFKQWKKVSKFEDYLPVRDEFEALLGLKAFAVYIPNRDYDIEEDKFPLVNAMAGPHGHAVCKALAAQLYARGAAACQK